MSEVRTNCICPVCGFHTVQIKTKNGFVCKECHTLQKEEGNESNVIKVSKNFGGAGSILAGS